MKQESQLPVYSPNWRAQGLARIGELADDLKHGLARLHELAPKDEHGRLYLGIPQFLVGVRACLLQAEINQQTALLEANKDSLYGAIVQALRLGADLSPDCPSGYLIPYGKIVRFDPNYRLVCAIAARHGGYVQGQVVFVGDKFEISFQPPSIHHIPDLSVKRCEDTIVGAWAKLDLGDRSWVAWLSKEELDARRAMSPANKQGKRCAWDTSYEGMALAKVLAAVAQQSGLFDLMLAGSVSASVGIQETDSAVTAVGQAILAESDFSHRSASQAEAISQKARAEKTSAKNNQLEPATTESATITDDQRKEIINLLYAKDFTEKQKSQMYEQFAAWLAERNLAPRFAEIPAALFPVAIAKIKADATVLKRRIQ